MPQIRRLRQPPITEAIVDIRVVARPDFEAEEFSVLTDRLNKQFPKQDRRRGAQFKVGVGPTGPILPELEDLGFQGYFLKSEDERLIAQFRIDGFTLNRLKPYTGWRDIFPLSMRLWDLYRTIAAPIAVPRVALRYINHLPLLPGANMLDRYLRAAPTVPEELPQHLSAFSCRVTVQDPHSGKAAHIALALEAGPGEAQGRILLDIDAFKTFDDALMPDNETIEAALQELHDFKNLIFFSYLTEEVLEQFA